MIDDMLTFSLSLPARELWVLQRALQNSIDMMHEFDAYTRLAPANLVASAANRATLRAVLDQIRASAVTPGL